MTVATKLSRSSLALIALAALGGCAAEEPEVFDAASSAFHDSPADEGPSGLQSDARLFFLQKCDADHAPVEATRISTRFPRYTAELDLRDPRHPRYRLRTYVYLSSGERVAYPSERNAMYIKFRNDHEWYSGYALVARPSSLDLRSFNADDAELLKSKKAEADARDPWDDLPLPDGFMDRALAVRADGLRELFAWKVSFDHAGLNPTCSGQFYGRSDWGEDNSSYGGPGIRDDRYAW